MKSDPNSPRDNGKSRDSKAERPSGKPEADNAAPKRPHLLKQRGHRWARRNAHV